MITTAAKTIIHPNEADRFRTDMEYPNVQQRMQVKDHASAVAFLKARRAWWLEVASAYLDLVEAGCDDAMYDAKRAFSAAEFYSPEAVNGR